MNFSEAIPEFNMRSKNIVPEFWALSFVEFYYILRVNILCSRKQKKWHLWWDPSNDKMLFNEER